MMVLSLLLTEALALSKGYLSQNKRKYRAKAEQTAEPRRPRGGEKKEGLSQRKRAFWKSPPQEKANPKAGHEKQERANGGGVTAQAQVV